MLYVGSGLLTLIFYLQMLEVGNDANVHRTK